MDSRTLTQHERKALLQFEAIYEDWRQAADAWLTAEFLLWTEALHRGADSPEFGRLRTEAARLRDASRNAYLRVVDALMQADPD